MELAASSGLAGHSLRVRVIHLELIQVVYPDITGSKRAPHAGPSDPFLRELGVRYACGKTRHTWLSFN